jgi:formiminotetrahydrofolate cyclodeaminase
MPDSIWTATLADFRDRVASLEPVPAGVSAAAVTATLGFGLLIKVVEIASRRKNFAGDPQLVRALLTEARTKSQILSHLADDDIAAFHDYLDCLRAKQPMDSATRKTIDVPLNVARAASSGLVLCEQAKPLMHAFIASDLAAAVTLLTASRDAALLSVKFNLQQLPPADPYRSQVSTEVARLSAA